MYFLKAYNQYESNREKWKLKKKIYKLKQN